MAGLGLNGNRVRFGLFELDTQICELRKAGVRIRTRGQPIQMLKLLVERAGEVVTREELRQALWADDTFVDFDHSLNTAIKRLRQALDDDPESPRYIETVPRIGYRFIGTLEATVQPVVAADAVMIDPVAKPGTPWRLPLGFMVLIASVAVVITGLLVYEFTSGRSESHQHARIVPLTTLPGREISPALSPDGTQVAFGWDGENEGAGYDLYVKVIGSEGQLRLTHSPTDWISTAWSPDGTEIAVIRGGPKPGVFLVPALGGPERKIANASIGLVPGMLIAWSPSGKQLALVRTPTVVNGVEVIGTGGLELLSLGTGKTERISDCHRALGPSFSPRGDQLSYGCQDTWNDCTLRVKDLTNGKEHVLESGTGWMGGTNWIAGTSRIVFPMQSFDRSSDSELWTVDATRSNSLMRIENSRGAVTVSGSRQRLVYSELRENTNIWKISSDGAGVEEKLVSSTAEQNFPVVSPDDKKIAFESTRSGSREIWIAEIDGSNPQKITSFGGPLTGSPSWSPDSAHLAFDSRAEGKANIYIADISSGAARKIETGTELNSLPVWSRDGAWIYYHQGEDANPTIWKVAAEGGRAIQLTTVPDLQTQRESTDGKYLYSLRNGGKKTSLWRIRTDGSGEEQYLDEFPVRIAGDFRPVKSGIFFIGDVEGGHKQAIEFLDFKTRRARIIHVIPVPTRDWIGGLDVTPDGKWILFTRLDASESDLKLVENWY